jgi:hypothetical protein
MGKPVTKNEYDFLASLLGGKENSPRVLKKNPQSDALSTTGQLYENREYVAAYECFKPVYDRVVADMQRVLARNVEFEANKLAKSLGKPLPAAKERVLNIRSHAQQVLEQFERLLSDLESKPLVRHHIKKGESKVAELAPEEAPPTILNSASETRLDAKVSQPIDVTSSGARYTKAPYVPPQVGNIYLVRDKLKNERVIRVTGVSADGALVQIQTLKDGEPSTQTIELPVESLARQAEKGWCSLLLPSVEDKDEDAAEVAIAPAAPDPVAGSTIRLDSQNFSRCCADIVRANLKFSTQLIKDVADGPFRAGNFDQAFLTFEQLAVQFNSAVGNSRRAIADGRRTLAAEKNKLSGKEVQDRTAAFLRSEQLIHTAEREFSTILEGLRMCLRSQPGEPGAS